MLRYHIYLALIFAFILGSHEGFIALWEDSRTEPLQVYPYLVSSLPPDDQIRLKEGIHIASEQELAELLEDYLS